MINVSNAFKQELFNDRRNYLEYADITLKDGTVLNLKNKDLWGGGLAIEDAVSKDDSFDVGSAIINKCTVVINNIYDDYSKYDFGDAKVVVYVGLNLPDGTIERIRKGTYTIDETAYNGSIITLQCLDNMSKFDKPYSESKLNYPATLNQIVRDACDVCKVTLQTYNFPHDDFIVQTRPDDEAITFREIISWCAQIAGCFCRCDTLGRLELKWYDQQSLEKAELDGGIFDSLSQTKYMTGDNADGGSFNPWNTGYVADGGEFGDRNNIHYIYSTYSMDISADDVVITGVKVVEKNKEENQDALTTYQSGTDGYVVSIENNELIKAGAGQTIVGWLGEQLIGFRFRKASFSHASDPTIEAGDVGFLIDRKQNMYRIAISSTKFSTGNSQTTASSAQKPLRNSAARFSAETKNYVEFRKDIEKERTEREKAQDELKDRIDNSSGLYTTEVTQSDGSTIFYMHDKPVLAESMIVWKMTAEAWGVSTDGGKTYNAGMTVDGDTIVRILTATGVNADWVKTGAFQITKNGKTMVLMDIDTGQVILRPDVFEMSSGETIESIAKEEADNAVSSMSQTDVLNKLTNNGTDNGIYLLNGKLYVSFSAARGGTLTLGGANNTNGELEILDSKKDSIGKWNNTGFQTKGKYFAVNDNGSMISLNPVVSLYLQMATSVSSTLNTTQADKIKARVMYVATGSSTASDSGKYTLNIGAVDYSGINPWVVRSIHLRAPEGLTITGPTTAQGNFTVTSSYTKSKEADTENYGHRLLYCYEMPSPMFGDIGEGETDENGECYIDIGDIFSETVSAEIEYHVFLQKEGEGDIWIAEKNPHYFCVKGTANLRFAWEIKAKQKGFEYERLEQFDDKPTEDSAVNYEAEYMMEIERLIEEQEELLDETA